MKISCRFQQNSMWFWLVSYECHCTISNMRTLWEKLCNEEVYPNHEILCKTSYQVMSIALACECIGCCCETLCFLQPGKSWSSSLSHLAGNRISQVECSSAQIDQMTTCSNDFRPRQPSVIQFSISQVITIGYYYKQIQWHNIYNSSFLNVKGKLHSKLDNIQSLLSGWHEEFHIFIMFLKYLSFSLARCNNLE